MKALALTLYVQTEDSVDTIGLRAALQQRLKDLPGVRSAEVKALIPPIPVKRNDGTRSFLCVDPDILKGAHHVYRPDLGMTPRELASTICNEHRTITSEQALGVVLNHRKDSTGGRS
jgi:hypothetical protein